MNIYVTYHDKIEIDAVTVIVAAWNSFVEDFAKDFAEDFVEDSDKILIFPNSKEFFENSFKNATDVAYAISTGDYRWTDYFVYFNNEGRLMSFSRLNEASCPVDLDKIDISSLIQELQDIMENKKEYVVNNIPRAIHDALQD